MMRLFGLFQQAAVGFETHLDEQTILPLATKTSFGLAGSSFQLPDYENVETFVERLLREEMLVADPVVQAVLAGHMPEMSLRTRASVVSCWRPD